jgi:hypothetical protein
MLDIKKIRKILILYDEKIVYIGDSCLKFDRIRFVKHFFNGALLDINTQPENCARVYSVLLKGNPHINNFSNLKWPEIDFLKYDLVITISHEEKYLLRLFREKYGAPEYDSRKPRLLSLSRATLHPANPVSMSAIPEYKELQDFVIAREAQVTPELYLSHEEREWGNDWLKNNGLEPGEQLNILVDSASKKEKLLGEDIYFEVVAEMLKQDRTKLLVFDAEGIGKKELYTARLGKATAAKIIFCNRLGLRQALCIIGADATKLILGPCTGLLHCASGIYNIFNKNATLHRPLPLMIVYTGIYTRLEEGARRWWGHCPLVHCLLLRDYGNGKEIRSLKEVEQDKKTDLTPSLPCSEYTAPLLINTLRKLGGIK